MRWQHCNMADCLYVQAFSVFMDIFTFQTLPLFLNIVIVFVCTVGSGRICEQFKTYVNYPKMSCLTLQSCFQDVKYSYFLIAFDRQLCFLFFSIISPFYHLFHPPLLPSAPSPPPSPAKQMISH